MASLGGLAVTAVAGQTFRSGVDAVTVDVLVTRDGQPVTGLTAERHWGGSEPEGPRRYTTPHLQH